MYNDFNPIPITELVPPTLIHPRQASKVFTAGTSAPKVPLNVTPPEAKSLTV